MLQPVFVKSDKNFAADEITRAASMTTDRSANERAMLTFKSDLRVFQRVKNAVSQLEVFRLTSCVDMLHNA